MFCGQMLTLNDAVSMLTGSESYKPNLQVTFYVIRLLALYFQSKLHVSSYMMTKTVAFLKVLKLFQTSHLVPKAPLSSKLLKHNKRWQFLD